MGDKFDNPDFLSRINKFDFVVLTETWSHQTVHTPGFKCFTSTTNDSKVLFTRHKLTRVEPGFDPG